MGWRARTALVAAFGTLLLAVCPRDGAWCARAFARRTGPATATDSGERPLARLLERLERHLRDSRRFRERPRDAAIRRRSEAILAELEGLRAHPWAGVYRDPENGEELVLAPGSGFVLRWSHVVLCGVGPAPWRAAGTVHAALPGLLTLAPDPAAAEEPDAWEPESPWRSPSLLHIVPWGPLQFAVPDAELASFYSQVHDGSMPAFAARSRASPGRPPGPGPLPRPEGLPARVAGREHLLLDAPVRARITALVHRDRWSASHEHTRYALDAGATSRLASGMHMHVELPGGRVARGTLEHVAPLTSLLRIEDLDSAAAERLVGREASTRGPGR